MAGVYYLITQDNEIVYVGMSTDLKSRLRAHSKMERFSFCYFSYTETFNYLERAKLEKTAIEALMPIHNVIYHPEKWDKLKNDIKDRSKETRQRNYISKPVTTSRRAKELLTKEHYRTDGKSFVVKLKTRAQAAAEWLNEKHDVDFVSAFRWAIDWHIDLRNN